MVQVRQVEEPIAPVSFQGVLRSCAVQFRVYQERDPPVFAFCLGLCIWTVAALRMFGFVQASNESICLHSNAVVFPNASEWRRYLGHAVWPMEPGYVRNFLVSTILIMQGYSLEYQIGTLHFATLFILFQGICSLVLLHFRFATCLLSIEPALAGMLVVMHRENPGIHSDSFDKGEKVPWTIEPRWHVWILFLFLHWASADYASALACHVVGAGAGLLVALREPQAWAWAFKTMIYRPPGFGLGVHFTLFFFSVLFIPLTTQTLPQDLLGAIMDGRVFSGQYWSAVNAGASLPLLHMALAGMVAPQVLFILKTLIGLGPVLVLSTVHGWFKFYTLFLFITLMYCMNTPFWQYPHAGFLLLPYFMWAFWALPGSQSILPKRD